MRRPLRMPQPLSLNPCCVLRISNSQNKVEGAGANFVFGGPRPECGPGPFHRRSADTICEALDDLEVASTWRAGQTVSIYLMIGSCAVTAQDNRPGRATFAEMIAFARLASVACQHLAPDADSFHALALRRLVKPSTTEEEIAAKVRDVKRLRVRLGLSRWCKRYAGEMEQARILVQVLRRQN